MTEHDERHSDSTLAGPFPELEHRRAHHGPIPWADPAPGDRYAPAPPRCRCRDRVGFKRLRHEWDRDGRCLYCGKRGE